jgi:chemotaxis family two-component system response regulator Rcp1
METTKALGNVLLIDDEPGFGYLLKLIIQDLGTKLGDFGFAHLTNPLLAPTYLDRDGGYADSPRPDLILLDLNMPQRNGLLVLEDLRAHPVGKLIPIVVVSDNSDPDTVGEAYDRGASSYLIKPKTLESFETVFHDLLYYWFVVAEVPG